MSRTNDDAAEALMHAVAEAPGVALTAAATERVRADVRMVRRLLASLNTKGMVTAQRLQVEDAREAIERIEAEVRWGSSPHGKVAGRKPE
jgi:hypothetical protein